MEMKGFVLFFSLLVIFTARGDEKIELDIVLVGSDETLMTVPAPWVPEESLSISDEDPRLESFFPSPVRPPSGDWPCPIERQFPRALLSTPRPSFP